jgi:hypothetical protein
MLFLLLLFVVSRHVCCIAVRCDKVSLAVDPESVLPYPVTLRVMRCILIMKWSASHLSLCVILQCDHQLYTI